MMYRLLYLYGVLLQYCSLFIDSCIIGCGNEKNVNVNFLGENQ